MSLASDGPGRGAADDRKRYPGEFTTGHRDGYSGKAMDLTTSIYDYGFRDYAPELARFIVMRVTAP